MMKHHYGVAYSSLDGIDKIKSRVNRIKKESGVKCTNVFSRYLPICCESTGIIENVLYYFIDLVGSRNQCRKADIIEREIAKEEDMHSEVVTIK